MGVILGHMRLFGAQDIGFTPLGPVRKKRAPGTPASATVEGKPDKRLRAHRRKPGERKPIAEVAAAFLASVTGTEFSASQYLEFMDKEGWGSKSYARRELDRQIGAKKVKVKARGLFIKLPALVKAS
jgi:hypothetical protein